MDATEHAGVAYWTEETLLPGQPIAARVEAHTEKKSDDGDGGGDHEPEAEAKAVVAGKQAEDGLKKYEQK